MACIIITLKPFFGFDVDNSIIQNRKFASSVFESFFRYILTDGRSKQPNGESTIKRKSGLVWHCAIILALFSAISDKLHFRKDETQSNSKEEHKLFKRLLS